MAFNFSPKIVTNGLVLYLDAANTKSYPGSGTTWTDISRGGNNGTLTNGPTFNNANGGSIVFDGVDDYSLFQTSINLTTNYTFSSWINPTTITSIMTIAGMSDTTSLLTNGWVFRVRGDLVGKPIETGVFGAGGGSVTSSISINIGWQYVVFTKSNTSYNIYINGISNTIGTITSYNNSTTPTAIGVRNVTDTKNHYFNGNISQVSIYNRALSAQEIQQNFNATRTRFGI